MLTQLKCESDIAEQLTPKYAWHPFFVLFPFRFVSYEIVLEIFLMLKITSNSSFSILINCFFLCCAAHLVGEQ